MMNDVINPANEPKNEGLLKGLKNKKLAEKIQKQKEERDANNSAMDTKAKGGKAAPPKKEDPKAAAAPAKAVKKTQQQIDEEELEEERKKKEAEEAEI